MNTIPLHTYQLQVLHNNGCITFTYVLTPQPDTNRDTIPTAGFVVMDDGVTWMNYNVLVVGEPQNHHLHDTWICPFGGVGDTFIAVAAHNQALYTASIVRVVSIKIMRGARDWYWIVQLKTVD